MLTKEEFANQCSHESEQERFTCLKDSIKNTSRSWLKQYSSLSCIYQSSPQSVHLFFNVFTSPYLSSSISSLTFTQLVWPAKSWSKSMTLLPLAVGCCVIIPFWVWHDSHTSMQSQRGHNFASISACSWLGWGQALMWQAEIIAQLCIYNQSTQTSTHTSLLDMRVVSAPTPRGGAR